MGMEFFFSETFENLHILTRMSATENFIEFFRRENFKAYDNSDYSLFGSGLSTLSWTLAFWNKTSSFLVL